MPGTKGHSGGSNKRSRADHTLRGSFQPSRHAGLGDPPVPPAGDVVKPARLSVRAAVVWDDLSPLATALGTLTVADVAAFTVLCELVGTYQWIVELKTTDPVKFSPKLEQAAAASLRPYLALFGLDPASRARLHLPAAVAPPVNPLARFLTRKRWPELT